jgi:hypothetical protein
MVGNRRASEWLLVFAGLSVRSEAGGLVEGDRLWLIERKESSRRVAGPPRGGGSTKGPRSSGRTFWESRR